MQSHGKVESVLKQAFFLKSITESIIAKMKEASKQTLASMLERNANMLQEHAHYDDNKICKTLRHLLQK